MNRLHADLSPFVRDGLSRFVPMSALPMTRAKLLTQLSTSLNSENQDLGVVKAGRKPVPKLDLSPFPLPPLTRGAVFLTYYRCSTPGDRKTIGFLFQRSSRWRIKNLTPNPCEVRVNNTDLSL